MGFLGPRLGLNSSKFISMIRTLHVVLRTFQVSYEANSGPKIHETTNGQENHEAISVPEPGVPTSVPETYDATL